MDPKTVRIPCGGLPEDTDIPVPTFIECDMEKCEHGEPTSSINTVSCVVLLGRSICCAGPFNPDWIGGRCVMCYRDGTIRCDDCLEARYCSLECLDYDRKVHAPLCASFRHPINGFRDSNRPTAEHVRILTLPSTGTKGPVFGWARRVKKDNVTWDLEFEDPEIVDWHTKNPNNHTSNIINMGLGLLPLGHSLQVHWAPLDIKKASPGPSDRPFNRSIASLAPPGQLKAHGVLAKYGIIFAMVPEVHPDGDTKTIKDMTFRDAQSLVDILLHGSGAQINNTHFWAVVSFLREGQLLEDANNGGKPHEWPTWVVEALGPDHSAKLKHGRPDKEAFRVYWDIWKVHVGHQDMESPWEFEERHKHEAVFMSPDGTWPSMGVSTSDYCRKTDAFLALEAKSNHAKAVGHVNDTRAAELEAYNDGKPRVFSEPTDENRWMDDLGQSSMNDLVGRFKTVCPRKPTRPQFTPGHRPVLRVTPEGEDDPMSHDIETLGDVENMHSAGGPSAKAGALVDMFRGAFGKLYEEYRLRKNSEGDCIPPLSDRSIRAGMSIPAEEEELSEQLRRMTMDPPKE